MERIVQTHPNMNFSSTYCRLEESISKHSYQEEYIIIDIYYVSDYEASSLMMCPRDDCVLAVRK